MPKPKLLGDQLLTASDFLGAAVHSMNPLRRRRNMKALPGKSNSPLREL
jgi:hypothetical protein